MVRLIWLYEFNSTSYLNFVKIKIHIERVFLNNSIDEFAINFTMDLDSKKRLLKNSLLYLKLIIETKTSSMFKIQDSQKQQSQKIQMRKGPDFQHPLPFRQLN